jgi:hypothetical protein
VIEEHCITSTAVANIKVEENGRSAILMNPQGDQYLRIKVDGCVEMEGIRADWVIERGREAVVIELKGRGVEHGADQILATAQRWRNEGRFDRIGGLIVARQYPRASASIQLRQQRFARGFAGPLHVVTRNASYRMEWLLSFKGPFRS